MNILLPLWELYLFTCAILLHGLIPAEKSEEFLPF